MLVMRSDAEQAQEQEVDAVVAISELSQCLSLLEEVSKTKNSAASTRRGKAIADVIPAVFGNGGKKLDRFHVGQCRNRRDIVSPVVDTETSRH